MSKLSSQSSKRKYSKLKRVAMSKRHARNIGKMRNASTPLRRRLWTPDSVRFLGK